MRMNGRPTTTELRGTIRLHLGAAHESAVADRLVEYGYTVQPWGQGLIRDEIRQAIQFRAWPVLWRWIPDLIAVRGRRVALVDPKTGWRESTGNVSIEMSAIAAHRIMESLGLPVVYVFGVQGEFLCTRSDRLVVQRYVLDTGDVHGGSGTPFGLINQRDLVTFDAMFGPPAAASGAP